MPQPIKTEIASIYSLDPRVKLHHYTLKSRCTVLFRRVRSFKQWDPVCEYMINIYLYLYILICDYMWICFAFRFNLSAPCGRYIDHQDNGHDTMEKKQKKPEKLQAKYSNTNKSQDCTFQEVQSFGTFFVYWVSSVLPGSFTWPHGAH